MVTINPLGTIGVRSVYPEPTSLCATHVKNMTSI